jgi:hypothetical protein
MLFSTSVSSPYPGVSCIAYHENAISDRAAPEASRGAPVAR